MSFQAELLQKLLDRFQKFWQ